MFNIAICDDETEESDEIRKIVEEFLKEKSIIYQVHIYMSGEELLSSFEYFDFVFLDISMKGINGIETGIRLFQKNKNIKIVYITNYKEYCNDAVNHVHAFAYISKPIEKEKLIEQINELIKVIGIERGKDIEIELFNVMEVTSEVKQEFAVLKIPVSDIIYFEYIKANRKIKVKTQKNKIYEYSGTIGNVEEKMRLYGFATCYRGILVNCAYIIKVKSGMVFLNNGEKLPLAQKRAMEFKEKLNEYIHGGI